ncbi:DUF3820 family protein [Litoribacter alkaliphilus]|uniref:DUF3820 family protein n=1 Tax=Litoribacter ruber TaxID=702568 RepID=A0AAP2CIS4_9BACT|nr:DUF3820 family protein [Litoribacter alkaliphilus]MBS9524439.1 DUF3820 family protein [Litoribacter alkaliphilus]
MENEVLVEVVTKRMPFGKYKGFLICDIPEHYLVWMKREGFPDGKLGMWLSTMYEIKLNGLEDLLLPLRKKYAKKM